MVGYWSILLYGIVIIVVSCVALLVAYQDRLIYVPVVPGLTRSYPITPSRLRLLYQDVWLTSSDNVRLHAWFIKLKADHPGFFTYVLCIIFVLLCMCICNVCMCM